MSNNLYLNQSRIALDNESFAVPSSRYFLSLGLSLKALNASLGVQQLQQPRAIQANYWTRNLESLKEDI
jgi:hypothetical protein